MKNEREYSFIDRELNVGGKSKLQVILKTKEFGNMRSRMIESIEDTSIKQALWNSLAEELMDEYDRRLNS